MQSESAAVVAYPLPLLRELIGVYLGQGLDGVTEGVRMWDQLPSPLTVEDTFDQALLSRCGKQAPVQLPKLTFSVVVGAW